MNIDKVINLLVVLSYCFEIEMTDIEDKFSSICLKNVNIYLKNIIFYVLSYLLYKIRSCLFYNIHTKEKEKGKK